VSGEDKQELRVPIEGLGEPYEGLSSGPLDLARLDPADLRSREAAPPRQPPHGETRTHACLFGYLGQPTSLVLHSAKFSRLCTLGQILMFASDAIRFCYVKRRYRSTRRPGP
jgi:hypothetical protein